jgi:hypothetical protein
MLRNWLCVVKQLKWQYMKMHSLFPPCLSSNKNRTFHYMLCWNDTKKYDFFEDKVKYSMFDTKCQRFWIYIPKILVSHIHKNTVMNDELTVTVQSSMQFLPIRLPTVVLQRVWKTLTFERNHGDCYVPVCRQKNYSLILMICMAPIRKCFLSILSYLLIFSGLIL